MATQSVYTLAAYNHCVKYGAPALARFIAELNLYKSGAKGDAVNCAKWTQRYAKVSN